MQDWLRLLSLFERPTSQKADGQAREGGLIVVHDGARTLKLLHTRAGRLEPSSERWPQPLEALADRHKATWAAALHLGALEELMERFGARTSIRDDIGAQILHVTQILREMAIEGAIESWPRSPGQLPQLSKALLPRSSGSVLPAGKVIVLGLFDKGELWTALVLRHRKSQQDGSGGGIDLVLGPDELRAQMGLLSGDWRRDYRHLASTIDQRVGPLGVGLFTEVAIARRLLTQGSPGSWAKAVAIRDVIVSPMSGTTALPLTLDAIRGAWHLAQRAAERFDPTGTIEPVLKTIGERAEKLRQRGAGPQL